MSFNLGCYQSVIRDKIEKYLVYNDDKTDVYYTIVKRSVFCDLIRKNISFIHEIDREIEKEEEWRNTETLTDGSKGQADCVHEYRLKALRELRDDLLKIKRISDNEVVN